MYAVDNMARFSEDAHVIALQEYRTEIVEGRGKAGAGSMGDMLRRTQNRGASEKKEQKFERSLSVVEGVTERLELAERFQHQTKELFKRCALHPDLARVIRRLVPLTCALVFLVCRREGMPRTLREICAVTGAPRRAVGRCTLAVAKALGLQYDSDAVRRPEAREAFVDRFASRLRLPTEVAQAAKHVVAKAQAAAGMDPGASSDSDSGAESGSSGGAGGAAGAAGKTGTLRNEALRRAVATTPPSTLCAAALMMISGLVDETRRDKVEVAAAAGVAPASVAAAVKVLAGIDDVVPDRYYQTVLSRKGAEM